MEESAPEGATESAANDASACPCATDPMANSIAGTAIALRMLHPSCQRGNGHERRYLTKLACTAEVPRKLQWSLGTICNAFTLPSCASCASRAILNWLPGRFMRSRLPPNVRSRRAEETCPALPRSLTICVKTLHMHCEPFVVRQALQRRWLPRWRSASERMRRSFRLPTGCFCGTRRELPTLDRSADCTSERITRSRRC